MVVKARFCKACNGKGWQPEDQHQRTYCRTCGGVGDYTIDPNKPTSHPPGSNEKVLVMGARYRAGLPLDNPGDKVLEERQYGLFPRQPKKYRIVMESGLEVK